MRASRLASLGPQAELAEIEKKIQSNADEIAQKRSLIGCATRKTAPWYTLQQRLRELLDEQSKILDKKKELEQNLQQQSELVMQNLNDVTLPASAPVPAVKKAVPTKATNSGEEKTATATHKQQPVAPVQTAPKAQAQTISEAKEQQPSTQIQNRGSTKPPRRRSLSPNLVLKPTLLEQVKAFFKRHKLAILIGTLIGLAIGVTLFFAWPIPVVTAASAGLKFLAGVIYCAVGASAGAGISAACAAATDSCTRNDASSPAASKKPVKSTSSTTQMAQQGINPDNHRSPPLPSPPSLSSSWGETSSLWGMTAKPLSSVVAPMAQRAKGPLSIPQSSTKKRSRS